MATDFLASRRQIEARQIEVNDGPLGIDGYVSYDERIESQPRERLRVPPFVAKATTPAVAQELDELLGELWELNEDHVGERTREAEIAICHDEEFVQLRARLLSWSGRFCDMRLDKPNPKDRGDQFARFLRIASGVSHICVPFTIRHAIYYVIGDALNSYVPWHLYCKTYRRLIERACDDIFATDEPLGNASAVCRKVTEEMRFQTDGLGQSVHMIRRAAPAGELDSIARMGAERIRSELNSLASDIQEIRPFLVHNFNEAKTLVQVGDGFWIAWIWGHRFGIADIIGGESKRCVLQGLRTCHSKWLTKVDLRGRLLDPLRPWSLGDGDGRSETFGLVESLFVLRKFHDRLAMFYENLELNKMCDFEFGRSGPAVPAAEVPDIVFTQSCHELAETAEEAEAGEDVWTPKAKGLRIRKLRFKQFVDSLEKWFGCEVRGGKGSEFVIHRPGHRLCILARHGLNPEYSFRRVRGVLKRLGISEVEWVSRIYGIATTGT